MIENFGEKGGGLNRKIVFLLWTFLFFGAIGNPGGRADAAPDPVREKVIVAFGDSLTAGLGVAAHEGYPAVLEQKMKAAGYSYRVVNSGVSGETTAGGLRRVDWILRSRPGIVILELGANDGLRGLDLSQTEKNLSAIIERLQNEGVKVILAGMKMPPNYGREYTEGFEKIFPKLAAKYRLTLIPFFLDGVAAQSNLNQADGIHPTAQGYRIIVDRIWPIIEPLLEK
ncbi:MAG: arylesterase [Candidatus Manganitrophaceae bacterium]|nr:MAG: arylesterase [Candidatus Manganitrophaceae bacterium]